MADIWLYLSKSSKKKCTDVITLFHTKAKSEFTSTYSFFFVCIAFLVFAIKVIKPFLFLDLNSAISWGFQYVYRLFSSKLKHDSRL